MTGLAMPPPLAAGPLPVERFRALLGQHLGLCFDDTRLPWLGDVLRRWQATGPHRGRLLQALLDDKGATDGTDAAAPDARSIGQELAGLAHELTVGETYFFRQADQLRALQDQVVPQCLARPGRPRRLHVLSAGCASGDEPYSIAMLLHPWRTDPGCRIAIHGVDLNPAMIEQARRGHYSAWHLRELPQALRQRWFHDHGGTRVLDGSIRAAVSFQVGNLLQDGAELWPCGAYDVVFCRNVLMYLTPSAARQVVAHITHALVPGGHLFLGHAETLRGLSQDYELCQADTAFYYRRRPPADRASMARAGRRPVMPVTSAGWTPPSWTPHWADAIGQAAERIRRLTADRSPAAPVHDPGGARPPLDQALALLRHERFAEALDLLQALPERAAGEPEVRLLRAVLLTHGGHFDAAATACLPLLREQGLAPEGADHGQGTARPRRSLQAGAYYVLALCREAAGDAAGAMQHDRAAAQLDPTFAMPHLHLGLVALRQGERALAGQALTSALALLPGTDDLHLLLFGGGFRRDTLAALCRAELRRCRHDERAS